ncbi:hypothetical protein WG947_03810 [Pontibacter sp. H259]|uniref:hypothetical protein n=1 Tax=Pontibacter sp. H259 TaxID=3133421 RepID=UPI0030BF634E
MKILVLLFASLFGFGVVCQDVTSVAKPAAAQRTIVPVEEPVTTVLLDTVTIVYEAPVNQAN